MKINYLVKVIGSGNHESINEARDELKTLLGFHELKNAPLLIFANKQDLPNSMNTTEIDDKLKSILFKSNFENSSNHKISSIGPHICVPPARKYVAQLRKFCG